ncbi:MAG: Glu-tRNA(Gln) amidotransferase subunit GatE [Candidatus Hodarchaeota archaeon]
MKTVAMVAKKEIMYKNLGFQAGIEIHAQLLTNKKLFCNCTATLSQNSPLIFVKRKFRPVLGEMGEFDPALLIEFKKGNTFFYEVNDSVCTYELDETPPFSMNEEALYSCITLAKMMNCHIVEETTVCRKNYIDGSVPCGFQRTALVGYDGFIFLKQDSKSKNEKKLPISWIYIEEDAARKDSELSEGKNIYFKLDRLGIPLVEIVTHHNLMSPTEVVSAACALGMLIKSSGMVRRGLGALRQDINVSIAAGNRVELKGIQLLQLIPTAIDFEIKRQLNLIEMKKELKKREISAKDIKLNIIDVTDIFSKTSSRLIKSALERNEKVLLLPVIGFKGLLGKELQPNKSFATELSEHVTIFTNLKVLIHSDEDLSNYDFNNHEITEIEKKVGNPSSAFIIVVGNDEEVQRAFSFIHARIISTFEGVPQETRKVNEKGLSSFIRNLHGKSRLYPDTDLPPVMIDFKKVEEIEKNLPEDFWSQIQRISSEYKISMDITEELVYEGKAGIFEKLMKSKSPMKIVLTTLTQILRFLSREGVQINNITDTHLLELFEGLKKEKFAKEAIPEILTKQAKDPSKSMVEIINKLGGGISQEDLEVLILDVLNNSKDLIKDRGTQAFSPLMGLVMRQVRGKIDGKIVSETLRKFMKDIDLE